MNQPLETAHELYLEMRERGMHLRHENGRDNALIAQLCDRVGCQDLQLARYLEKTSLRAADFLNAFLDVASPFARMFKEIWSYLAGNLAPKARERIRLRFGFDEESPTELDIDQFREYVQTCERARLLVNTELWSFEALHGLFEISQIVGLKYDSTLQPPECYRPGRPYEMIHVPDPTDSFEDMVYRVRQAFQAIADQQVAAEAKHPRDLPELRRQDDERPDLDRGAWLLTDLLPTWNTIFVRFREVEPDRKSLAVDYFRRNIEPQLGRGKVDTDVALWSMLDVLSLPFWHHRWQTYEIWTTVVLLRSLGKFNPRLMVEDGYCPLDGFGPGIVAMLHADAGDNACVVLQLETPFVSGRRRAIKPDLSICRDASMTAESRIAVVEFKQRASLTRAHVEEVGSAYLRGSPNAGGVIIVNYDDTGIVVDLPDSVSLLEGVRPDQPRRIEAMTERLRNILDSVLFIPARSGALVLLDVSSSMGQAYRESEAQRGLHMLMQLEWLTVFRFNDGLIPGGDLPSHDTNRFLLTSGGTNLSNALDEVALHMDVPSTLLIVTDGEYGKRPRRLDDVERLHECFPHELPRAVEWLLGDS